MDTILQKDFLKKLFLDKNVALIIEYLSDIKTTINLNNINNFFDEFVMIYSVAKTIKNDLNKLPNALNKEGVCIINHTLDSTGLITIMFHLYCSPKRVITYIDDVKVAKKLKIFLKEFGLDRYTNIYSNPLLEDSIKDQIVSFKEPVKVCFDVKGNKMISNNSVLYHYALNHNLVVEEFYNSKITKSFDYKIFRLENPNFLPF